ncbi:hypothetical protein T439DRAFT_321441 [Meredithblackwellia eburnea MCA 4105]
MWFIEGTLSGSLDDVENEYPAPTSHYLRPGRRYKLGRLPYATTNQATGKTLKNKPRLLDFALKNGAVSKDGQWIITTGDWTDEQATDNPASSTNLDPYTLRITSPKQLHVQHLDSLNGVLGDSEPLMPDQTHELRDGDVVTFLKGRFIVKWLPVVICFATASAPQKVTYLKAAQSIGIKVAFKNFLPSHHTHFIVKNITSPTYSILLATMALRPIVSAEFFSDLKLATQAEARPTELPIEIPEAGADGSVNLSPKDEQELLESLERNPGFDIGRWWNHCLLEQSGILAFPGGEDGQAETLNAYLISGGVEFRRDDRRRTLFEGIIFINLKEETEGDEQVAQAIKLGSGHLVSLADVFSRPTTSLQQLIDALDDFKEVTEVPAACRSVIFPPADTEGKKGELLAEFAKSLDVKVLTDDLALTPAITKVDPSPLFNSKDTIPISSLGAGNGSLESQTQSDGDFEPTLPLPTPTATDGGTSLQPMSMMSSFRSVDGTHPEESSLRPPLRGAAKKRAEEAAKAEASRTEQEGEQQQQEKADEEAPTPVRKLTRRARTKVGAAASGNFDDMFGITSSAPVDDNEDLFQTQGDAPELGTATETGDGSGNANGTEDGPSSYEPSQPVRKLKRRAGTQEASSAAAMFSLFAQTEAEGRANKRVRSETPDEAMEVDKAPAAAPLGRSQKKVPVARALTVVNEEVESNDGSRTRSREQEEEEEEGAPGPSSRKRRATSEPAEEPAKGKKAATSPARKKLTTAAQKKAAKEKEKQVAAEKSKEAENLLQLKTSKRRGAELDQGLNDDFNALKIVKPTLQPMRVQKKERARWDENDLDEEYERLIREDQEREEAGEEDDHPRNWGGVGRPTGMFVVEHVSMVKRDRPTPKTVVDYGQFAGRPDFKKFRSKKDETPRPQAPKRIPIELKLDEPADFGLGEAYNNKPKPAGRKVASQSQRSQRKPPEDVSEHDFDDNDDDEFGEDEPKQAKLNFKTKGTPKPSDSKTNKGKRKGKAKADIIIDSSDSGDSGATGERMDVDGSDSDPDTSQTLTSQAGRGKASSSKVTTGKKKAVPSKSAAKPKTPASSTGRKAPTRKTAPPPTMMIDEDDGEDSDDGLTFKGFGGKRKR